MAREWQQTRMTEYLMPDAVYYQSIWAVRDLERMEKRAKEIDLDLSRNTSMVKESKKKYRDGQGNVEEKAMELAILNERIEAIRNALSIVPMDYRSYVLSNIILQNPGSAFPNKFWRIWKQRFLFSVAKNLSLM